MIAAARATERSHGGRGPWPPVGPVAASPPAAAPARGDKDADKKPVRKAGAQAADKSGEKAGTGTKSKAMAAADAEVISLDSFRKKN